MVARRALAKQLLDARNQLLAKALRVEKNLPLAKIQAESLLLDRLPEDPADAKQSLWQNA